MEEQLFWVPDEKCLCMLWHVGHIAHRERTHIGVILQRLKVNIIPPEYEVFGPDWCPVERVRESVGSVKDVFQWIQKVRDESIRFIKSLGEDDWHKMVHTHEDDLTIAHWVFLTVAHEAIHIGKIQLLRAMLEGKKDRAC